MYSDAAPRSPDSGRRRQVRLSLIRAGVGSVGLVVAYFTIPMSTTTDAAAIARLTAGIVLVAGLLVWQVGAILHSPYPRARAIEAMAVSLPLFLLSFAATYFILGQADPTNWSEPLDRLDALYFTLTVFATVGFGDIVATATLTRTLVTGQMAAGLVLVGLIARVVVGAMEEGLRRRRTTKREDWTAQDE
jgi:voltage-gated potassium channel